MISAVTDDQLDDRLEMSGPIDYLVVEFPGARLTGEALPILVDLVDRGLVRIIDLRFVRRTADGRVTAIELADLDHDGTLDVAVFEGVSSGLLDDGDLDEAGAVLEGDCAAAVLVYENVWAAPFARAVRRSGGQLIASGRIPVQAILARLDADEASD
jgi:hypothetical protein